VVRPGSVFEEAPMGDAVVIEQPALRQERGNSQAVSDDKSAGVSTSKRCPPCNSTVNK